MQDLLDRIRERNFGKQVEFREYSGDKPEDLGLISAGIQVCSVYVNNQDLNVTVYDFNSNRRAERYPSGHEFEGEYNDEAELDYIITDIIRAKFD